MFRKRRKLEKLKKGPAQRIVRRDVAIDLGDSESWQVVVTLECGHKKRYGWMKAPKDYALCEKCLAKAKREQQIRRARLEADGYFECNSCTAVRPGEFSRMCMECDEKVCEKCYLVCDACEFMVCIECLSHHRVRCAEESGR